MAPNVKAHVQSTKNQRCLFTIVHCIDSMNSLRHTVRQSIVTYAQSNNNQYLHRSAKNSIAGMYSWKRYYTLHESQMWDLAKRHIDRPVLLRKPPCSDISHLSFFMSHLSSARLLFPIVRSMKNLQYDLSRVFAIYVA